MRDSATAKAKNKRLRQDNLREQLAAQGHLNHVINIMNELNNEANEIDPLMVDRKKFVINTKLKLINKYLPDLKSIELSGDEDSPVNVVQTVTRRIVKAEGDGSSD